MALDIHPDTGRPDGLCLQMLALIERGVGSCARPEDRDACLQLLQLAEKLVLATLLNRAQQRHAAAVIELAALRAKEGP